MLASLDRVVKYFGDKLILDGVSAVLEDNDRVGLIGANGIGKSTLLHILCGKLDPDGGEVGVSRGVRIGMLEQNSGLSRGRTVYAEMQSVFAEERTVEAKLRELETEISASPVHDEGYNRLCEEYSRLSAWFEAREGYQMDVRIRMILNGMGFEEKSNELPVSALSGGEKTRLALAKLLLEEPELLILDEPTNHLDFRTLMWLEDYLQGYRGGLLVVSHDRYFLDKMVGKIWEIENRKLIAYKGNYTKYKQLREERIRRAQKEYEAQQLKISAMREYAEKNITRASTSNMAKSRLHQLENMDVLEKPYDRIPTPHFQFTYSRRPVKDVLSVRDLKIEVGLGTEKVTLSEGLTFQVQRGEKVALIGPNGVGKSTLLKALLGIQPQEGDILWGANVQTGYYEQENRTLNREQTALEELWGRHPIAPEYQIRGVLGQVLITGDNSFKKIGVLSGGERARVALAVLMMEHANTLILDEPTNHLDLQSKEELEKSLVEFDGTLIFVSHDRYFLNTIPTKIIALSPDGLTVTNGNFNDYLAEQQKQEAAAAPPEKPEKKETTSFYRSKQARAEQAKRRARLARLEEEITASESRISELEAAIADPETGADYERLTALCAELEETRAAHEAAFLEWAELSEEE